MTQQLQKSENGGVLPQKPLILRQYDMTWTMYGLTSIRYDMTLPQYNVTQEKIDITKAQYDMS